MRLLLAFVVVVCLAKDARAQAPNPELAQLSALVRQQSADLAAIRARLDDLELHISAAHVPYQYAQQQPLTWSGAAMGDYGMSTSSGCSSGSCGASSSGGGRRGLFGRRR